MTSSPKHERVEHLRRRHRSGSGSDIIESISRASNNQTPHLPSKWIVNIFLFLLGMISYLSFNAANQATHVCTSVVWWYGWLTAVCTGLGALPFMFVTELDKLYLGLSNGFAAGMMLAASVNLGYEGYYSIDYYESQLSAASRTLVGFGIGIVFIVCSKIILDRNEDMKFGALDGLNAKKAILIMGVMTLHSFSEGIGIGVAFGGRGGDSRGLLISTSLAIHNIPEGLAVSLVLVPRGLSFIHATLWSILSSLPQPIMALVGYMFVEQALPVLPVGLGFAAGAMGYVALWELVPESYEDTKSKTTTGFAMALASTTMFLLHSGINH